MNVQLPSGDIVEIDDEIHVGEAVGTEELLSENERLRAENSVLVDAAKSNSVLRQNVDKLKRIARFQRTSAQVFRKASRALWRHLRIELGPIREDGTRTLSIEPKGEGAGSIEILVPAERAYYIEQAFKPDGTFANREDVLRIMREREASKPFSAPDDGEEDE